MSSPYVGEIRMFAGNFAPAGWFLCEGQLLPIAEYETLFNLIGTTYGGDGQSTFALPDLRGRVPIHAGSQHSVLGQNGGQEAVALTVQNLPPHNHAALCGVKGGNRNSPAGGYWSTDPGGSTASYNTAANGTMSQTALTSAGSSVAHDNMQPYLCVNFIISLFGVFPSPT